METFFILPIVLLVNLIGFYFDYFSDDMDGGAFCKPLPHD